MADDDGQYEDGFEQDDYEYEGDEYVRPEDYLSHQYFESDIDYSEYLGEFFTEDSI